MGRNVLVLLFSALLVMGTVRSGSAEGVQTVTLAGVLIAADEPSVPHFEVNGYVLLTSQSAQLLPFVGREVLVTGSRYTGPSVYMKRAVVVATVLTPAPESLPIIGEPVSGPDSDPNPGVRLVSIPSQPISLFGTSFQLLFGKVERQVTLAGDPYFILLGNSTEKVPVLGSPAGLAAFTGQTVAAVAAAPQDAEPMHLLSVVGLDQDLAPLLGPGAGLIFVAPPLPIRIHLQGQPVNFDQAPIVGNGRTMVGLRAIAESLGAEVRWDAATKTARVIRGDRMVRTTLGNNYVTLRQSGAADTTIVSDVAPVIVGSRMMVPLRVLSEGLGLQVGWDPQTRTVTLE